MIAAINLLNGGMTLWACLAIFRVTLHPLLEFLFAMFPCSVHLTAEATVELLVALGTCGNPTMAAEEWPPCLRYGVDHPAVGCGAVFVLISMLIHVILERGRDEVSYSEITLLLQIFEILPHEVSRASFTGTLDREDNSIGFQLQFNATNVVGVATTLQPD